jgi:hypothetical protein
VGYRFPPEIIRQAIWLYLRFTLSLRDVEDLLAERGIAVSYETVRRWVNHFGPKIAASLRKRRPKPYTTWHLDEAEGLHPQMAAQMPGHPSFGSRSSLGCICGFSASRRSRHRKASGAPLEVRRGGIVTFAQYSHFLGYFCPTARHANCCFCSCGPADARRD